MANRQLYLGEDAITTEDVGALKYTTQSLTDNQKKQARDNVGWVDDIIVVDIESSPGFTVTLSESDFNKVVNKATPFVFLHFHYSSGSSESHWWAKKMYEDNNRIKFMLNTDRSSTLEVSNYIIHLEKSNRQVIGETFLSHIHTPYLVDTGVEFNDNTTRTLNFTPNANNTYIIIDTHPYAKALYMFNTYRGTLWPVGGAASVITLLSFDKAAGTATFKSDGGSRARIYQSCQIST